MSANSQYPLFYSFHCCGHRYGHPVEMVSIRVCMYRAAWGRRCESPRKGAFAHDGRSSSGAIGSGLSNFNGSSWYVPVPGLRLFLRQQNPEGGSAPHAAFDLDLPPVRLDDPLHAVATDAAFLRRADFRRAGRRPGAGSAIRSIITGGRFGNRATKSSCPPIAST